MLAKISWRLIIILIGAGIIALLTFNYLSSLQDTTKVVVTKTDIPDKTVITADMLETVTVETQSANALVQNQVNDADLVIGAITRQKINSGEPMKMDSDLIVFPEDRLEYLSETGEVNVDKFIPNDKRLFTLGLYPENAVDNRLQKGDFVDVILTGETASEEIDEVYARMILQHTEVYTVENFKGDQLAGMAKDGVIQHVTLIVSPQEAVALANAREKGNLSLTLNPSEGHEVDVQMIYESTFER